ncbi:hypothetical protein ACFQXB_15835 [Plastorhodobacter daqingensis]|uniref:Cytochrome C oxidase assembly protein n=1 Tax=Plastorhodobacter daqingensis TaxID=1387281 RepID=A0ABW2UQA2_9RHOB
MAIIVEHELHKRRLGRNVGLGVVLIGFVVLVFGLTVAKVSGGGSIQGFDHTYRPALEAPRQPEVR